MSRTSSASLRVPPISDFDARGMTRTSMITPPGIGRITTFLSGPRVTLILQFDPNRRQNARLDRVLRHADADATHMTVRLLFSPRRYARFNDADEGIFEEQFLVLEDHL